MRALGLDRILLLATPSDYPYANALRRELHRRHIPTDLSTYGASYAAETAWQTDGQKIVAILPRPGAADGGTSDSLDRAEGVLDEQFGDRQVIAVMRSEHARFAAAPAVTHQLVIDSGRIDELLSDVVRAASGPWPPWLAAYFSVDNVIEPTGVAWRSDDLLVTDTQRDHLIQLSRDGSVGVVLPGLSEPRHVAVDRRRFLVANAGDDSILTAQVVHGKAAQVREVVVHGVTAPHLARPRCAVSAQGRLAIADTDNHRVLLGDGGGETWSELPAADGDRLRFHSPCALHLDSGRLWVANSDIGSIDVIDLDPAPHHLLRFGTPHLEDPVGLIRFGDWLFVADEMLKALVVFKVEEGDGTVAAVEYAGTIASGLIRSPFGLSINRLNELAVTDRDGGCIWVIALHMQDMDALLDG